MEKITLAARILFGLILVVFGADFFLHFMPQPEEQPTPEAMALIEGLFNTGYLFQLIKITEIAAGLMLLTGFLVPLALTLVAPIVVNIVLYHTMLDTNGLVIAIVVLALELFLAWSYRDSFRGVLAVRATPTT